MKKILIYTSAICPYCVRAKQLLDSKKLNYEEIRVDDNITAREEMMAHSGRRTVPQIFIDGKPIGGFDDLAALENAGKLDALLRD